MSDNLEKLWKLLEQHIAYIGYEGEDECNSHWIKCSCGWSPEDSVDEGTELMDWQDHFAAVLLGKPLFFEPPSLPRDAINSINEMNEKAQQVTAGTVAPSICPDCDGTGKQKRSQLVGDKMQTWYSPAAKCRRCGGIVTIANGR